MVLSEMTGTRKYELKRRGEQLQDTRLRITEATMELHRTVGPAATRITEIARRAGVQRVTVYNHFPDDTSLFAACGAHWQSLHPAPDPTEWVALDDAERRTRLALARLYAWYRETEPMTANVLRDAQVLPGLASVVAQSLVPYIEYVRETLAGPWELDARDPEVLRSALVAVTDFHFWRSLAPLDDDRAALLATGLVALARDLPPADSGRG
jgi:AcrR family transcriptional regulator